MPVDLIAEVRNKLGAEDALPKIDPNTQQPQENKIITKESSAIPAVLAGMYKKTRNEEDANSVLNNSGANLLNIIFGTEKKNVINRVAQLSENSETTTETLMQHTADAAKAVIGENVKNLNANTLINFFTDQRSDILKHLPAELNIGELINDPAMDDKTNKMEGPMSGLMHGIEKIFSSTK